MIRSPAMSEAVPSEPDRVRVVLVEPSHAGNIGAAARAMKTMGLSRLAVVARPDRRAIPDDPEAITRSSGAEDLLEAAGVFDDLGEAVADCTLVVGTSGRKRQEGAPTPAPAREVAERLATEERDAEVAVVFGPERTGLRNEHLALCDWMLYIPTNPAFRSLNLAAAVQLVSYELWLALGDRRVDYTLPSEGMPTVEERTRLLDDWAAVLEESGFLPRDRFNYEQIRDRFGRLLLRARPDSQEMRILRGAVARTLRALRRPES
ncbi:MAG: RNA methyltransferase [Myxococcota bacterium]